MKSLFVFFVSVLAFCVLSGFSVNSAHASSQNSVDKNSMDEVKAIAEDIDSKIEVTEADLNAPMIEVESEEELKNILKKLSESDHNTSSLVESPVPSIAPFTKGSFTRKSLLDAVLTYRHITFDYTKKSGKVKSVKNVKGSYIGVYVLILNKAVHQQKS